MKKLDWYIIREHIAPFFISIFLIMLLFTLNLALKMLKRIVGQGLEPMVITEFFFLNLAWIITLAVPMGVLVSSLMAFGRFAGDLEIDAMKSSGLGLIRLIRPVFLVSILVGLFSLYFQDQVLPDMNHRNKLLTQSIRQKKPHIALKEGVFTRDLPKQTVLVERIDGETGWIYDLIIFDQSSIRQPTTILADSGRLSYIDTLGIYQFDLYSGEIHQMKRAEPENYEILAFETSVFRFDSPDQVMMRRTQGYRSDRELGLKELKERIKSYKERDPTSSNQRMIRKYKVEFHKKYTISAAVLVFVLIGAPLGVRLRKGGIGVSGGLSVFFFLLYWSFLIAGEDLADDGHVSPWLAMWAPNILLGAFGLFLVWNEIKPLKNKRISKNMLKGNHTYSIMNINSTSGSEKAKSVDQAADEEQP